MPWLSPCPQGDVRNGVVVVEGRQREGRCGVVVVVTDGAAALTPVPEEEGATASSSSSKDGDGKDDATLSSPSPIEPRRYPLLDKEKSARLRPRPGR